MSHYTSYCLIEVVTKAGLTVTLIVLIEVVTKAGFKLTAFSPHKVVHHAVFCKYYAELAKTFFLSDFGSDRKWGSV
jgi:hypothetical protein